MPPFHATFKKYVKMWALLSLMIYTKHRYGFLNLEKLPFCLSILCIQTLENQSSPWRQHPTTAFIAQPKNLESSLVLLIHRPKDKKESQCLRQELNLWSSHLLHIWSVYKCDFTIISFLSIMGLRIENLTALLCPPRSATNISLCYPDGWMEHIYIVPRYWIPNLRAY